MSDPSPLLALPGDPSSAADPSADPDRDGCQLVVRLFLRHQAMLQGFLDGMCEEWEVVEEGLPGDRPLQLPAVGR